MFYYLLIGKKKKKYPIHLPQKDAFIYFQKHSGDTCKLMLR